MIKNRICLFVLTMTVCLSGCQVVNGNEIVYEEEPVYTEIINENGLYYKVLVAEQEVDTPLMLNMLIPELHECETKVNSESELVEGLNGIAESINFSLLCNDYQYNWIIRPNEEDYLFWSKEVNNANIESLVKNEDQAQNLANDIIGQIDGDFVVSKQEVLKTEQHPEGIYRFDYCQEYDGILIYNENPVGNSGTQIDGPQLHVSVGLDGVSMVSINNIYVFDERIEEYKKEDFLQFDVLQKKIKTYCDNIYALQNVKSDDVEIEIIHQEIIYMSQQEGIDLYIVPVFCLTVNENINDKVLKYEYLVNVFSGYVYNRMLIS